ncbi:heme exporter protein CcmD [Lichenihabitans sp. Uapishka_5]|uniref:heme exporter protein CcmD n=1 Tax=Lichenihabitans sp. Uapishka_5 TaxID=3037302 RepID=UPI0029E8023C|nr:heme exporter protein CcmD [Lichenihabitans sp. Uapishka_5]MDX7953943.1 heme exporter protein CcmD [Lichenihabitans sp. Uapishka_5]
MTALSALLAVPHVGFILAAYGVTAAVLGGTVAALVLDRRRQTRRLRRFDPRGRGAAGR